MKNNRILVILLMVSLLVILAACGGGNDDLPADNGPATDEPAVNADEGSSGADDEPSAPTSDLVYSNFTSDKIDPAIAKEGDTDLLAVSGQIYSRLVELKDGNLEGGLAVSWSISDDQLTYEFQLRNDAVFSDGSRITSDVILANFNRWFDPENPLHGEDSSAYAAWKANFDGFRGETTDDEGPISKFDGIEKVDNLVFLIHLNVPMENFLEVISGPEFSILNPTLMVSEGGNHATQQGSVVGSGVYQVSEWDGNSLTLTPSETYWGSGE